MATSGVSACFVCGEFAFSSLENKLLTSTQCGHKVCRRCLQQHNGNIPLNRSHTKTTSSVPVTNIGCPICSASTTTATIPTTGVVEWIDREALESQLEQEKLVRQRVMAVYNLARGNFEATPQYNDFLEKREDAIYTLTFSTNEKDKKRIEEELEAYEADNQKLIVECRQKALRLFEDEIRNIVEKEGTFYEIVQQNFRQGFRYFTEGGSTMNFVHTLQRAYPELFVDDNLSSLTSALSQKPTGSLLAGPMLGMGGQPKPLQANIVYSKIPRRTPTDKNALYKACGMSKELIGRRVMLELWGGLQVLRDHHKTKTKRKQ